MTMGILESREVKAFEEIRDIERRHEALTNIYALLEPELNSIKKSYKKFLAEMIKKRDKKRVKIIVGVKSLDSLKSKVIERGKCLSNVKDLVRATILLTNDDEVKKLYFDIMRKKSEVICCTEKEKGGDADFGYYGSYHIILFYKGLNVELQIMTRKLWSYKAVAHEFYDKYRNEDNLNIDKFDLHLSKMFFSKGNKEKIVHKRSEIRRNYKKLIPYFR
jgi:hypothetical protein